MATMQKWQMEHFEDKVKRQFNPLIEDQELLIRQFRTRQQMLQLINLLKKWVQIKSLMILGKQKKI